jgi:hypothetical protein
MGKERLLDTGYYIEFYGKADKNLDADDAFGVTYISPLQKCKYIHWWGSTGEWATLSWVCAPTKKKLQTSLDAPDDKEVERYIYFPTHEELLTFPFLHQKPAASSPAPV